MFRADHSDASYGSASVLSRSPRYSGLFGIWNGITSIPKEDHILVMLLSQVGKGVEEYSATDMDGIREDWSIYAVTSIFK
ncbi:hypothetical protein HanXRQr2_Chr11g0476031 [Helianthus annuus]|uniref:Uncharacterized protein n=1 Tax=Helianthus annuus TaxID=4232 RepID=A0A251SHZ0_HELAN|nr:hypothetical protein HanXRQr2_Chr11g0476031 [Helianthus annuus]